MTSIRPIHAEEGAAFLRVLCDVFDLDFRRAESVFFTEPLFDLQRKWALFEGPKMLSVLTTVPLEFGWGRSIGIAGVATLKENRNEGLAGRLLDKVLRDSEKRGETGALLFAKDEKLYKRLGFETLEPVISGTILGVSELENPRHLSHSEVREHYDRWALEHPNRLRRDDQRWKYWQWNLRTCSEIPGGYLCFEGNTVREVVGDRGPVPVGEQAEWLGLPSMAEQLGIQVVGGKQELILMGRGVNEVPQMFLTDQF